MPPPSQENDAKNGKCNGSDAEDRANNNSGNLAPGKTSARVAVGARGGRRCHCRQGDGRDGGENNACTTPLGVRLVAAGVSRVDSALSAIGTKSHGAISVSAVFRLVFYALDAGLTRQRIVRQGTVREIGPD